MERPLRPTSAEVEDRKRGQAEFPAREEKTPGFLNLGERPRGWSVDARPSAIGGRLGRGKPDDLVREAGGGRLE